MKQPKYFDFLEEWPEDAPMMPHALVRMDSDPLEFSMYTTLQKLFWPTRVRQATRPEWIKLCEDVGAVPHPIDEDAYERYAAVCRNGLHGGRKFTAGGSAGMPVAGAEQGAR